MQYWRTKDELSFLGEKFIVTKDAEFNRFLLSPMDKAKSDEYAKEQKDYERMLTFIRKVSEKISTKSSSEGIIYKYVPSDLVKSISADGIGGVHEIKEPTVIRNEGVLVGLNSLLAEGTLTLPNGEMVKRNPNSIIIMTSNSDLYGKVTRFCG